jgi:hypothetical protein
MKLFTPNRFLVRNFSLICLLLIVLFFSVGKGWGQTTLISPTGDGGFETGSTFAANGWTDLSNNTSRAWYCGSGQTGFTGSRSAFIGNSTTNVGSNTSATVSHIYRSISIPAGSTNIQLTFKYKQATTDNTYDYLRVSLLSAIPTSGTVPSADIITTIDPTSAISSYTTQTATIANTYAGTTRYLVFTFKADAVSPHAYGAIDDISIIYTAAAPCSGTPAPGNTLASVNPVGGGSSTVLSLQNTTPGTGLTYQWKSSTNNTNYTIITGATSATYSASPTVPTYYVCEVTCSGTTTASNPLQVNLTYCTPTATSSTYYISNFTTSGGISNINLSSIGAAGGYINNSAGYSCSQFPTGIINISIGSIVGAGTGLSVFIDWNNNFSFTDAGEKVVGTTSYTSSNPWTSSFTVPVGTPLGNYRMRVVNDYNSTTPVSCPSGISGEVEDYTFNVIAQPTCMVPTSLTSSSISYQTTTIGWTAPATGTSPGNYEYEIRTSGAAGSGATGLVTSGTVSTNTANITSLTGGTTYTYYVRSSCGSGDFSFWASSTFTTTSCASLPTGVGANSITTSSATISWTAAATGSPSGYEYEVRTSGAAGSGSTGLFATNTTTSPTVSANINGLSPATTYRVYVRTLCYSGFNSSWTTAVTFNSGCPVPLTLAASGSSTAQTYTTISGSFTAASSNPPTGYIVVRSTSATAPSAPVAATALPSLGNTTMFGAGTYVDYINTVAGSWTSSSLINATTYYYYIFSYNNTTCSGGPVYSSTAYSFSQSTQTCPTFAGTISINGATAVPGTSYPTLTAAIADIKFCGVTQPTIFELTTGYLPASETYPIVLSAIPGASATNTLTIREAASFTGVNITSNNTTATLDINGGQYWIIDGRPGGVGSADLQITNTSVATGGTAVRLINEASNNTLRYLKLVANFASTANGVVLFSTTTGLNGNDNNTLDNNSIDGNASCAIGVYSGGTGSGSALTCNSGNVISNNLIFNNFSPTVNSQGVFIDAGSTDWTISGNSFYQTASRTITSGGRYCGIEINSSGNNFLVSNNYIGGNAAQCSGTTTYISSVAARYRGISLKLGTTTPSLITGNIINGFNVQSNSGATTAPGVFSGIYFNTGSATIGSQSEPNTIGSTTSTGGILVSTSTTGGISYGISSDAESPGILSICYNNIGSISTVATATTISHSLTAIHLSSTASYTVNNNLIGSNSAVSSLNASCSSTSTTAQVITGINNSATGNISIQNNTVSYLNNAYIPASTTTSVVRGISTSAGTNTITGNTIRNLTTAANATGTTSSASVIGISMTSTNTPTVLSQNTIYTLGNTNSSAISTGVIGIHYNGPSSGTNLVARNFIYGLSSSGTSATGFNYGINVSGGATNFQNNMIVVGQGNNSGIDVRGINDLVGTNNYYHNTVYVGGAPTANAASSFAFNSAVTTNTRIFRNNIFINARSNNGSMGKHYCLSVGGTSSNPTGLTSSNNLLRTTGTGAVFGLFNSLDVASLSAWQIATGQDANSISSDPCLVNPTAATPDLHLTDCATAGSPAESSGILVAAVTDDFDGQTRSSLSPTDIGADAGNYGPSGIDMKASALVTPIAGGCKTATESVSVSISNISNNAIDFSVNNLTVSVTATGGYSSSTILNTGTLAPGASQTVVLPNTIDMTASGTYTFNASTSVSGDVNTSNDAMLANSIAIISLGGTHTVGTGGNYTTLTSAVTALNNCTCITAPVIFSLTSTSYTTETLPIVINSNSNITSTNTLTIRPASGVVATISGSFASGAMIRLNGADYITIDGSNSGGTDKSLTFSNTSTTNAAGIWIASLGNGSGAVNNTIKNCIINVNTSLSQATTGISISGSTLNSTGADNDNITIQNNTINSPGIGIYAFGTTALSAGGLDNLSIQNNTIITGSSSASTVYGIEISNSPSSQVNSNILNLSTSASTTPVAISIEAGVSNSIINANQVQSCVTSSSGGYGGRGITIGTGTTTSNITVSNNMIAGVNGTNFTTFGNSSSVGIMLGVVGNSTTLTTTTGGINIYHNSVNMSGNYLGSSTTTGKLTAALYIGSGSSSLNVINNILVNSMINTNASASNYAIYNDASGSVFSNINFNDYYVNGSQGILGYMTSNRTTLSAIISAFGGNTNSVNIAPSFSSVIDLHLNPAANCSLDNKGTFIAGVTTDFDGATRSNSTPDLGADEFTLSNATWIGVTSSNVTTSTNWNNGILPSTCSNVVIQSGCPFYPSYTNLNIDPGTTYTLQAGAQLTISGTLTNNGTLTLESGATLVQGSSSTLAGSGTYNVKQAITGDGTTTPSGRFWYLGSPVSLASSSVYFASNAANVVKKRSESTNAWTSLSSGTPENLVVGQGYYTQAIPANSTINFTGGLLNNGAISITNLTRTAGQGFEGFNLVSNPYPSYLNWDDVSRTYVDGTMWYRTHDGTNMVFETYVAGAAGGVGTNLSGNTATKYIPPMQSYWVRVTQGQTSGSLALDNTMRSHFASLGSSTAGLRSTQDDPSLFLRMNLLQANKKDQLIVYVNEQATNGFDMLDGEKMMQAGYPQFYTKAGDKKIVINGLNSAKKQQSLPITMELPTTGVHSFIIEDLEIDNGLVWLEDKQEEIIQALEPGTVYEFYANSGINAERFVLHFQLIDNATPINIYNEVNSSANFSGKGANVYAESAGVVVIKLPASTEGVTDIQIRDAAGKLVYSGSMNNLETSVELAQANGIYYVTLSSNTGVEVRKVFIQQ